MTTTVSDIIDIMESIAPPRLAEEWDNVGLQVGQKNWHVSAVMIALDPDIDVIAYAVKKNIDILITHHPLIFRSLNSIDFASPIGSVIYTAARHKISVFASHTNLDSVAHGVNDVFANKIGLKNLKPLRKIDGLNNDGLGRVGNLDKQTTLISFALEIKKKLGLEHIKIVGKRDMLVNKVAVCSGSGSSLMNDFFLSGAEIYISGDLRYHDSKEVEAKGFGLIDVGHFASEHLIVDDLAKRLEKAVSDVGINVRIETYPHGEDPFKTI